MTIYTAPDGKKYERKFVGMYRDGTLVLGNPTLQGCQDCAFNGDKDGCLTAPVCTIVPNYQGSKVVQVNFKEIPNVR